MYKVTCKKCRRLGQSVCGKENCAIKRKAYAPGQRGTKYKRTSEYGRQLLEKQKLKLLYGLREKQFRNYFNSALQRKGAAGDVLLSMLEQRLDNVVFRLGFASTRSQARQLVGHGHFTVNKRKVTIPSFSVKPGDVIGIREGSKNKKSFEDLGVTLKNYEPPVWLRLDKEKFEGTIVSTPSEEVTSDIPVEIASIVEYYSR